MGFFTGFTHAIIHFAPMNVAEKTGIYGMMELCFGSDTDVIAQIMYQTTAGSKTPVWTLPERTMVGGTTTYPIFRGAIAKELLASAGRAADKLKAGLPTGTKKAGKDFRVTSKGYEEIIPETKEEVPLK
jgi:hypothetical protein